MTLNERLGGKGYKPRKDYAGRRVSGDWEDSDRGGGHKSKKRAGGKVEKKSPTYLAYVKNKNKALNNSYEPKGEMLEAEFASHEEVELFLESLVEQGYTQEEILLELDKKGLGPVILGKGIEYTLGGIKNTWKFGKNVYKFAKPHVVSGVKNVYNLGKKTRANIDSYLQKRSSGKYIKTSSNSGSGLNPGKTGVTKSQSGKITVKKPVEVLPPTTKAFKGKTIDTSKVSKGVNKGIVAGSTAALTSSSDNTNKAKTFQNRIKTVEPFQNRITGNGKKQVKPEKNPVIKKKPTERERSVDRAYGAQIAQTRKLKGDDAAKKLRQKFINRPITSKEMDESIKDELLSKASKAHKKAKNFKKWRNEAEKARQTALKPGEVRWMDKKTGKWKTNKPR